MESNQAWGGIAVITGGTKGMGLATAERVAPLVDEVVLVYRSDEEAAEAARAKVDGAGGRATLLRGDVGEEETFTRLSVLLAERDQPVTLLVHGAVDPTPVDLLTSDLADIQRAVTANGLSMILAARAVDPHVDAGTLAVFLSSKGAVATLGGYAGIGVPKAMAESATRYVAAAWAGRGARALVLAPGAVDTDSFRAAFDNADAYLEAARSRTPLGRLATPVDVAEAIVALRSPALEMVTGARLLLDGGVSLL